MRVTLTITHYFPTLNIQICILFKAKGRETTPQIPQDGQADFRRPQRLLIVHHRCKHGITEYVMPVDDMQLLQIPTDPQQLRRLILLVRIFISSYLSPSNDSVNAFLHQIYVLQETTAYSTFDASKLATTLEQTLLTIRQLVSSVHVFGGQRPIAKTPIRQLTATDTHDHEHDVHTSPLEAEEAMISKMSVVARLLPILLKSLDGLGQSDNGSRLQGSVIYTFVKTFKEILERICRLAGIHRHEHAETPPTPNISARRRGNQSHRRTPMAPSDRPIGQSPLLTSLCELAVAMAATLDTTKLAHARILEGCLFTLMTIVGCELKRFVFGGDENSILARGTFESQTPGPEREQGQADHTIEAHAPYLIYVLEQFQKLGSDQASPAPEAPLTSTQPQHENSSVLPPGTPGILSDMARKKLQHTLINAIFGENPLGALVPALQAPEKPANQRQVTEMESKDVRDWYKHQVWRLVGWDVLREHLGLENT